MVDRPVQKVISPFGKRTLNGVEQFHNGIDLRCYDFQTWKKQAILFPCECEVLRIGYQKEWGWNVVARPIYPGDVTEIKFIHLLDPRKYIKENQTYNAMIMLGWTDVTLYMKSNEFKEHLHFETWVNDVANDPLKFYDQLGTRYE
jgi:hypothetical protein